MQIYFWVNCFKVNNKDTQHNFNEAILKSLSFSLNIFRTIL